MPFSAVQALHGGVMHAVDHRRACDDLDPTALLIGGERCDWPASYYWDLAKRHARSGHIRGFLIWQKIAIRKERLMA